MRYIGVLSYLHICILRTPSFSFVTGVSSIKCRITHVNILFVIFFFFFGLQTSVSPRRLRRSVADYSARMRGGATHTEHAVSSVLLMGSKFSGSQSDRNRYGLVLPLLLPEQHTKRGGGGGDTAPSD